MLRVHPCEFKSKAAELKELISCLELPRSRSEKSSQLIEKRNLPMKHVLGTLKIADTFEFYWQQITELTLAPFLERSVESLLSHLNDSIIAQYNPADDI